MLQIILLILRIIGFVILTLLGLLLLVLLTVLFVPVRYQIHAEHGERILVKGWISWLLHVIHVNVSYIEEKLHIRVRIAGIVLFDNLKPRQPKVKKIKKKKIKKKIKKKKKQGMTALQQGTEKDTNSKVINATGDNAKVTNTKVTNTSKEALTADPAENSSNMVPTRPDNIKEVSGMQDTDNQKEREAVYIPVPEVRIDDKDKNKSKISFFKKLIERFRGFKEKLTVGIQSFKNKGKDVLATIKKFWNKWELISEFIRDKMNQKGFQATLASLKKLLKHVLPTRIKSKIVFGTGDPCSTGQLLGAFSILYSFYGDRIQLTPDFENSRFEGVHDIKGRIRFITILIIVIKLIVDKRFKQLRKNFTILKEAL